MSRDYVTGNTRLSGGPAPGTGEEDVQMAETTDLLFGDNEELKFGDASDVSIKWDASVLEFLPVTDDIGAICIGDGATDIDFKVFLGSTSEYVEFNVGDSQLNVVGVPAVLTPVSAQAVGFQVASQCVQAFKYECSLSAQQGAWVHGMKVEVTRAANVQPATGGWFGAQFVLNAGSSGYDALNKGTYVLQCVFKGSDTSPDGTDIHVGRFETQSAGKVSDIVHVLANTGTTIVGSLLYLAAHVIPGSGMVCINVQSSITVPQGIHFEVGAGSTFTSLLYATGAGTFTNFLEVAADGDGGVTLGTGMFKDPENDQEAGYITIKVGTTSYQIPFYASA